MCAGQSDFSPGAGARLPLLDPADLTAEQLAVYRAITGGPRSADATAAPVRDSGGRLLGPFNAMLYSPAVGAAVQSLGAAIRYATSLTDREREIAVLVVAAHHRSEFELFAHEPLARRAGLTIADLDALRAGGEPDLADRREQVVHATVRHLVEAGDLHDAAYGAAVAALGHTAVVELATLVGYYAALALQLRVFRVPVPQAPPGGASPRAGGSA